MTVVNLVGATESRPADETMVDRARVGEAVDAPREAAGLRERGRCGGAPSRLASLARRRREQLLYLVVGAWNTLFGYGVWALFEHLLHSHLHYLVIVVLSWPFSVGNAYIGYRTFVFRSKGRVLRELPRFSLVYVVTLLCGLVALPILLHTLPFSIYAIQAGFTAAVVVLSYLGHKFFSFRQTVKRTEAVKRTAQRVDTSCDGQAPRPGLSRKGA